MHVKIIELSNASPDVTSRTKGTSVVLAVEIVLETALEGAGRRVLLLRLARVVACVPHNKV